MEDNEILFKSTLDSKVVWPLMAEVGRFLKEYDPTHTYGVSILHSEHGIQKMTLMIEVDPEKFDKPKASGE